MFSPSLSSIWVYEYACCSCWAGRFSDFYLLIFCLCSHQQYGALQLFPKPRSANNLNTLYESVNQSSNMILSNSKRHKTLNIVSVLLHASLCILTCRIDGDSPASSVYIPLLIEQYHDNDNSSTLMNKCCGKQVSLYLELKHYCYWGLFKGKGSIGSGLLYDKIRFSCREMWAEIFKRQRGPTPISRATRSGLLWYHIARFSELVYSATPWWALQHKCVTIFAHVNCGPMNWHTDI